MQNIITNIDTLTDLVQKSYENEKFVKEYSEFLKQIKDIDFNKYNCHGEFPIERMELDKYEIMTKECLSLLINTVIQIQGITNIEELQTIVNRLIANPLEIELVKNQNYILHKKISDKVEHIYKKEYDSVIEGIASIGFEKGEAKMEILRLIWITFLGGGISWFFEKNVITLIAIVVIGYNFLKFLGRGFISIWRRKEIKLINDLFEKQLMIV